LCVLGVLCGEFFYVGASHASRICARCCAFGLPPAQHSRSIRAFAFKFDEIFSDYSSGRCCAIGRSLSRASRSPVRNTFDIRLGTITSVDNALREFWHPDVPWWTLIVRATVVYVTILFLLRISGKRQVGQMGMAEFVALLLISNAVQNAMNGGDN